MTLPEPMLFSVDYRSVKGPDRAQMIQGNATTQEFIVARAQLHPRGSFYLHKLIGLPFDQFNIILVCSISYNGQVWNSFDFETM